MTGSLFQIKDKITSNDLEFDSMVEQNGPKLSRVPSLGELSAISHQNLTLSDEKFDDIQELSYMEKKEIDLDTDKQKCE